MNTFIHKHIRRTNRNLVITGLVFILGPLAVFFANHRYFYNFFFGPFPVDVKTLADIKDPKLAPKYFVTLQLDHLLYADYEEIETKKTKYGSKISEKKVADYFMYLLPNIDKTLLIRMSPTDPKGIAAKQWTDKFLEALEQEKKGESTKALPDKQAVQMIGTIQEAPSFIKTDFFLKNKNSKRSYLPYIVDTENHFRTDGYIGLGIGGVFFLLGVWMILRVQRRRNHLSLHPIAKTLAGFGPFEQMIEQIEMELQRGHGVFQLKSMLITPSWLLKTSLYDLRVVYLEDLAWMYEQITQHRTNGIPTGKSYKTLLFDRRGQMIELDCGKGQAADIMAAILQRVPWILVGYSDELKNLWKINRSQMIAEVDHRKQEFFRDVRNSSIPTY